MSINTVCSSTNRGRRFQQAANYGPDSTGHCSRHSMYCYGHRHIPYYKIVSSILYWKILVIIKIVLRKWMIQGEKREGSLKRKENTCTHICFTIKMMFRMNRKFFLNHALNSFCVWSDIKGSLKQPLQWFMVSRYQCIAFHWKKWNCRRILL